MQNLSQVHGALHPVHMSEMFYFPKLLYQPLTSSVPLL